MQVARIPAPSSPTARPVPYGVIDIKGIKYLIVRPPVGSLSVLANTIYNQVTNEQEDVWMKRGDFHFRFVESES